MKQQLAANIRANLKFYRRNKLLIFIVIAVVAFTGLVLIPTSAFLLSQVERFETVKVLYEYLNRFAIVVTGAIGLLAIYHHTSNRCLKMVVTKPCSYETWLLGHFLSALIVCASLYIITFLISTGLFFIWNIPFQWGLVYVTLNSFFSTVLIFSFITFLTIILHPFIALLMVLFFQSDSMYNFVLYADKAIRELHNPLAKFVMICLRYFLYFIYLIFPSFAPFEEKMANVKSSYHVDFADLKYLLYSLVYSLIFSCLLYFLSVFFLKRKRNI